MDGIRGSKHVGENLENLNQVDLEDLNSMDLEGLNSMEFDGCEASKEYVALNSIGNQKNVSVNETSTPKKGLDNFEEPYLGMTFDSLEEGKDYYIEYGRRKGFSVRIRSSQKTQYHVDKVTSIRLVCSRGGVKKSKNFIVGIDDSSKSTNTIKCGCNAHMRILYDNDAKKWKVTKFLNDHNHKFVTPSKRIRLRTNRSMPDAAKDLTEAFNRENLPICKVTSIFGGQVVGFDNRNCYNHLRSVRLRDLEMGDAQSVLIYFQRRQRENPQFFYAIQLDDLGRAINFFWVDARSRMAYQHFGDMVTFDTTYRTNKYNMPFAPFTGVNHHYQTIQFGCALLHDETEATFYWLFTTWLEAMGGRHPVSIITDEDCAMGAAIPKVFPNTRHRLCLWHIKKKFGEHLSHVYYDNSRFQTEMNRCLHFTYSVIEFEDKWNAIIEEFGLGNNEWLKGKYNIRNSWVPVYHRGTFYAGMNTTGRSEGVNSFFNDFVNSKTNLRDFVVRYDKALKRIVEREDDEDYTSEHKNRVVDEYNLILKHAANIYTRNMFDQFRAELADSIRFKSEEKESNADFTSYLVISKVGHLEKFIVTLNKMNEGCCQCQLFEFKGMPCKHILKVLVKLEVDEIPSYFILKRWTKGANSFRVMVDMESGAQSDAQSECTEAFRLSHICRRAAQLSCIVSKSESLYKMVINGIEELFARALEEKHKLEIPNECFTDMASTQKVCEIDNGNQFTIQNPHISITKGRRRDDKKKVRVSNKGRLMSPIEDSGKRKRKCKECDKYGHDRRKCPKRIEAMTNDPSFITNGVENLR